MPSRSNRVLTDHEEIRRWAEVRNASPACVRGTGGDNDIGMLRLDFPGYTGARSLQHIDWNDWFDKFDERGLALLVQDSTAQGARSNFNKIVSRETAQSARRGRSSSKRTSARTASRARTAATSRTRATARKKKGAASKKSASRKRTIAKRTASSSRHTQAPRRTRSAAAKRTRKSASTAAKRASSNSKTSRRNSSARASRGSKGRNVRSIESGRSRSGSHVLTDHDEVRRWAEQRNAAPACVRGTGGGKDPGMIRLDFPGFSGERSLEHIDWDEWFRAFDDNKLALLVQDKRAGGGPSNFNKLIGRETAERRARGERKFSRRHPEKAKTARTRAGARNTGTKKADRGSTRAHRSESARGRTTSPRRAA